METNEKCQAHILYSSEYKVMLGQDGTYRDQDLIRTREHRVQDQRPDYDFIYKKKTHKQLLSRTESFLSVSLRKFISYFAALPTLVHEIIE